MFVSVLVSSRRLRQRSISLPPSILKKCPHFTARFQHLRTLEAYTVGAVKSRIWGCIVLFPSPDGQTNN